VAKYYEWKWYKLEKKDFKRKKNTTIKIGKYMGHQHIRVYTIDGVQPLCRGCNASKGNR